MTMSESQKASTVDAVDALEQERIEAVRAAGYMPIEAALFTCQFIGKELQGIPSQYRKLAISRLRNKVRAFEEAGISHEFAQMIEQLCSSWETFDVDTSKGQ